MKTDYYIDKKSLLGAIGRTLNTETRLSSVNSARRFGKSFVEQIFVAGSTDEDS